MKVYEGYSLSMLTSWNHSCFEPSWLCANSSCWHRNAKIRDCQQSQYCFWLVRSLTTLWISLFDNAGRQNMSLVTRKPVFGICNQGRLKVACLIQKLARVENMDITIKGIVLSRQWTTKALIRLRGCAGWSVPFLLAYGINRFSHDVAHIIPHDWQW